MLAVKRQELEAKKKKLEDSIAYIDWKENFYNDILVGKIPYQSNLIKTNGE